jgi:hypothetical protein
METYTNEKEYIVSHLIGYSNVTADSPAEAWARWLNDDCMDCGYTKEELRNWCIDNGYKTITRTYMADVYLIAGRSK